MDGSTLLPRTWALTWLVVLGLAHGGRADTWSWPQVAWRRAASFATAAEDQVAEAEQVLRPGMTENEALKALDGKIAWSLGTSLLDIHHSVRSRRFRKTEVWLTFRWHFDQLGSTSPKELDETAEMPLEVLQGHNELESWTVRKRE
ncbi:MAG: hypothetical protein U0836_24310 [Pirellulales bacterium]